MDNTYFSARGCYYLVSGSPAGSGWSVSPMIGGGCPVLYQGGSITGRDNVAKSVCFNDVRVAAATGKAFGELTVQGMALLGNVNNTANFGANLTGWFKGNRVSQNGRAAMFSSAAAGAHTFLLEWYNLGQIDDHYNIQHFSFGGACLD